jgi:hypothetical protein
MESDTLNKTTKQLPVQHNVEAAVLTDAGFRITVCHAAATALFFYNQQDASGHPISFLIAVSTTNSKIISLYTTRHVIAPDAAKGGYPFIYKPLDADQKQVASFPLPVQNDQLIQVMAADGRGLEMRAAVLKCRKIKNGSTKQPIIRL